MQIINKICYVFGNAMQMGKSIGIFYVSMEGVMSISLPTLLLLIMITLYFVKFIIYYLMT